MAGGSCVGEREFLQKTFEVIQAGAVGVAVGRMVWQHKEPLTMTAMIKRVLFEGKGVEEALEVLNS